MLRGLPDDLDHISRWWAFQQKKERMHLKSCAVVVFKLKQFCSIFAKIAKTPKIIAKNVQKSGQDRFPMFNKLIN